MHNQAHMAHQKKRTRANEKKDKKEKERKREGGRRAKKRRRERKGLKEKKEWGLWPCDNHFVLTFRPLLYSSPIDIVKTPSPRGYRHH